MIDDLRASIKSKIHLAMKINFMPSTDSNGKQPMHSNNNNTEIIIGIKQV